MTRPTAMAPDASTSPVDWSRPIEAVHEDGRVVRAFLANLGGDDIARVLWHPENANPHEGTFNAFGGALANWPWRIRNVQPTTPERDPALWDRMEALVIMMARIPCSRKYPKGVFGHEARYAFDEARDIAARLTIDPDVAEAREMLSLSFVPQTEEAEQLVLHAIKRGRELATPEVSHVG